MSNDVLHPFVHWAQDEKNVFLKIELRDVENPLIEIDDNEIRFSSIAKGARGENQYQVQIPLFGSIDSRQSVHKIVQAYVSFVLVKKNQGNENWWPRLLSSKTRPAWLKIDFDRWKDPEAEEISENDENSQMKKYLKDFDPNSMNNEDFARMAKELGISDRGNLDLRTPYLLLYNLALLVGFSIITFDLILGYSWEGEAFFPKTYSRVMPKLLCCQIAQWLDVAHTFLGYTRGGWAPSFMQNFGRSLIVFLLYTEPRLQDKPFVFYLILLWSAIELVRYPYYALATIGRNSRVVTWCRYTLWIPLYPLGFFVEGVILLRSIPYFNETEKFSLRLPNALNFGFDFGTFLQFYILFGLVPGICFLMFYMRKQRLQKLGGGSKSFGHDGRSKSLGPDGGSKKRK